MTRFFVMTRGRTGSTAIIDELNNVKTVMAAQELFIKHEFKGLKNRIEQNLPLPAMVPFHFWKTNSSWWKKTLRRFLDGQKLVYEYLKQIESIAQCKGAAAFGFKLLSHHFNQTPFLKECLIDQGYRVIYLTRSIPRQVISGMIAKQRGVYNRRNYKDVDRYRIDVDEFEKSVQEETKAVQDDLAFIKNGCFDFIQVSYEDFIADRLVFFARVLDFLGVVSEIPEVSDYSVMIKDLHYTIENIDAVLERIASMGMTIE